MSSITEGSIWVHKAKQTEYAIVCESLDEGTKIPLVTYRSFSDGQKWTRPRSAFLLKFKPLRDEAEKDNG